MPPIYEYRCKNCERLIELVQDHHAAESTQCTCGHEAERTISQTGPWNFKQ